MWNMSLLYSGNMESILSHYVNTAITHVALSVPLQTGPNNGSLHLAFDP